MAAIRKELIADKVKKTTHHYCIYFCYIFLSSPFFCSLRDVTSHCMLELTQPIFVNMQKKRVSMKAQLAETKKKLEQSEVLG